MVRMDPYAEAHLELVLNHPSFPPSLRILMEDLQMGERGRERAFRVLIEELQTKTLKELQTRPWEELGEPEARALMEEMKMRTLEGNQPVLAPLVEELQTKTLEQLGEHGTRTLMKEMRIERDEERRLSDIDLLDLAENAIKDPAGAPLPVRRFAEEWGVTPALVLSLLVDTESGAMQQLAEGLTTRSDDIQIWDTSTSITLRIPKPVSKARHQAAVHALTDAQFGDGPMEEVWGVSGSERRDLQPALQRALPWFIRWNGGEELTKIYIEASTTPGLDCGMTESAFIKRIKRLRDLMKGLSSNGIRDDSPSLAFARKRRRRRQ